MIEFLNRDFDYKKVEDYNYLDEEKKIGGDNGDSSTTRKTARQILQEIIQIRQRINELKEVEARLMVDAKIGGKLSKKSS